MKHIALYVRVSSKQQTTASQMPDLQRWAAAQEGEIKWYEDSQSGTKMDRPAWNRLEEAIRHGKVSQVVCWRIDRLGRTCSGLSALFDDLRVRKVNLVSLKDGLDLSTPAGRMMANVLASVAQFETEVRAERQRAGIDAALADVQSGKRKGWGGSKPGVSKKVTPTQAKMIQHMKQQGESVAAIAEATSLSRPTIYRIVSHSTM